MSFSFLSPGIFETQKKPGSRDDYRVKGLIYYQAITQDPW